MRIGLKIQSGAKAQTGGAKQRTGGAAGAKYSIRTVSLSCLWISIIQEKRKPVMSHLERALHKNGIHVYLMRCQILK